jgi:hypothetical protein
VRQVSFRDINGTEGLRCCYVPHAMTERLYSSFAKCMTIDATLKGGLLSAACEITCTIQLCEGTGAAKQHHKGEDH